MNEIFVFHGQEVRTVTINNEPWFVGKDVADILGYLKPLDAISRHVDEDDSVKHGLTDSLGRIQNTIIINESGLYSLILSSKLPQAKEFKRWVTSEVLPQIRQQGAYVPENLSDEAFIALFTGQKKLKEQQLALAQDVDYLKNEQPIHPSFAQALLKKRKARVVACLGGMDSPQPMLIKSLHSRSFDRLRLILKTILTSIAMTCYQRNLLKRHCLTG